VSRARAFAIRSAQAAQAHVNFHAGRIAVPAPQAKRRQLLRIFRQRAHELFVESGTYRGDTVAFFVGHARRIVSVEVDPALHGAARDRFGAEPSVEILLGDSLDLIPPLIADARTSTMLFLDGHFSDGVTGQGRELEPARTILGDLAGKARSTALTVVVDDLRLFGTDPGFPSLDELVAGAREAFPDARIYTGLDALIIEA